MQKKNLFLLFFVLLKFLLQFLVIGNGFDLHRDEYLYLDQANHPAWGFISIPPFTSWIAAIIKLLGNGIFWVKFFPALFGALTLVLVWKIIEMLKGGLFALCLGATALLLSVLPRIDMLFQPNSFDVLSWTALYFALISCITYKDNRWLWLAGLILALGFLNKYNILFLVLGLLPALLLGSERKLLLNRNLYYGLGLALLLVLPNLFWQYSNNFPVVSHMKELAATQLVHVKTSDFLKEQFMFFMGSILIILFSFVGLLFYKPFRPYRFIFFSYLVTIAIFIVLKGKAYYAIGLYPVHLAFGAVFIQQFTISGWKKNILRPLLIAIPVLLFIPMVQVAFPIKSPAGLLSMKEKYKKFGMLRWEDGEEHQLPQDFADMLGWRELAKKTFDIYESLPDKTSTLIVCDNYGQAGAINFYNQGKGIHAVSFNADYIGWFPEGMAVTNVILVKEAGDNVQVLAAYKKYFESVTLQDSVQNPLAREQGTTISLLKNASVNIWPLLNKRLHPVL